MSEVTMAFDPSAFDPSAFVGVPWLDRGRDRTGCDCWGLFRLAFEAGTGVALPLHAEGYQSAEDRAETAALVAGGLGDWIEVLPGRERRFDGVLIRVGRAVCHIGLVTRAGWMLHQPNGRPSAVETYHGAAFRSRLAGFWRHKSLI